jgi:hypothetical protein
VRVFSGACGKPVIILLYQISSDRRKHFIAFAPTDNRSSF